MFEILGGNQNKETKPLFYLWTPTGDGWRDGMGEQEEQVTWHFNKIAILREHVTGTFSI